MAKLELTVKSSYVPTWGLWEAIRELLQNAKDADDDGQTMTVNYFKRTKRLVVANAGADLTRESLLLGATTKAQRDDQRGQFGEGYKLALLTLARLGHTVQVRTPTETWTPELAPSDNFNADVLIINTRKRKQQGAGVEFEIHGLEPSDWARVETACLFLQDVTSAVRTAFGRVLQDEASAGKLYVGGLLVGPMPDDYFYGYDLNDVKLDRDRKLAEPWSLRWEVAKTLGAAVTSGDLTVGDVLRRGAGEMKALAENTEYVRAVAERAAEQFEETYGEDAVPVTDLSKAYELQHIGLRGVVVTPEERKVIEAVRGNEAERRARRAMDVQTVHQLSDLVEDEVVTLMSTLRLIRKVRPESARLEYQVVDFYGKNINGTYQQGVVRLARRQLLNGPKATLSTLVHEVAHTKGDDGEQAHVQEIQDIFASIVVSLTESA